MTRPVALVLLLWPMLSGCGEADRPRFVPATGEARAVDHRPGDGASRGAAIPKNIPMH